jgi:AcrR family transcriptional regulator
MNKRQNAPFCGNRPSIDTIMKKTSRLSTRERILAAAKEQFMAVGFESASVRAITDRANANSALLGYHFGSKENLFAEVINSIVGGIVERRARALEALREEFHGAIPLYRLIKAYAEPFLTIGHDYEREVVVYLRFFGRLFTEPSDRLIELLNAQMIQQQREYFSEFAKSAPHVDEATLIFRFKLLIGAAAFMGTTERMAAPPFSDNGRSIEGVDALNHFAHDHAILFAAPTLSETKHIHTKS